MDSLSRRYYEHQLGAGMGPEFSLEKLYGYTEPVRRLIQREEPSPQANEIPNTMPSRLPGDDYLINFRKGDPFSKVDQGYARLPGAGYAALHPELKDTKPENYPDIYRLSILADVAPYSREYNIARQAVAKEAANNTRSLRPWPQQKSRAPARPAYSLYPPPAVYCKLAHRLRRGQPAGSYLRSPTQSTVNLGM